MTQPTKPTIEAPTGPAPTDLISEDLLIGDGDEAKPGHKVHVHYVGVRHSDGGQFDASWDRGDVFAFRLGAGEVISGWDTGVAGMKIGGRRKLTIPPHLAYGDRGAGRVIPGGETIIFVVDLLALS